MHDDTSYKVLKVISDQVIQVDPPWRHHNLRGNVVSIAGLLPSDRQSRQVNLANLSTLILEKHVKIQKALYVSGDRLCAKLSFSGISLPDHFPERRVPDVPMSRWTEPNVHGALTRVRSGIPYSWQNPLRDPQDGRAPFFGGAKYPTRPWERNYERDLKLAKALDSDTRPINGELHGWFKNFLKAPTADGPALIEGPPGVGKSWFIASRLMSLDARNYHVVIFDLRNVLRGPSLQDALETELDLCLEHLLPTTAWMRTWVEHLYGGAFDPTNERQLSDIRTAVLRMSRSEKNSRRLEYYAMEGNPELVIAFDNIDHFSEKEQETVVDTCRRICGRGVGVRALLAIRPTTLTLKDRWGEFFADGLKRTLHMRSPDVHDVLRRRLTTNQFGETWSPEEQIPGTSVTFGGLCAAYEESEHDNGAAGLLRALCTTARITPLYHVDAKNHETTHEVSPVPLDLYDCRHYLRLFRRLLRSNALGGFDRIGSAYYAVQALMLRSDEPLSEVESYLFNLFDNEKPLLTGNALIRYRVLEYFSTVCDPGDTFDFYFDALGYSSSEARAVLDMFSRADLVQIDHDDGGTAIGSSLTIPGRMHFELVTNMWYIICVKTGMNIYADCVLYDEMARKAAGTIVTNRTLLNNFASKGWVPEEEFIRFIAQEQNLEQERIHSFLESNPDKAKQLAALTRHIGDIAVNLYYAYRDQMQRWLHVRARRPHRKTVM